MIRSITGFAAALVAVCCIFLGLARADEKTADKAGGCTYCKALKDVTDHLRCEGCAKADKPCDKCAAMAKKVSETAACPGCKEGKAGGCSECPAAPKDAAEHCSFCAEKKLVAEHSYCCKSCAAAKKTDCADCKKVRDAVMAIPCEQCAKEGKHEGKKG